jgi:hypothetical protein
MLFIAGCAGATAASQRFGFKKWLDSGLRALENTFFQIKSAASPRNAGASSYYFDSNSRQQQTSHP